MSNERKGESNYEGIFFIINGMPMQVSVSHI